MTFRPSKREPLRVRKDPDAIKNILGAVLKRHGLDQEIDRYRFVLHWPDIVGADIARRTKPECLRNGSLVIRVTTSAWAQELAFHKATILARLKRFLGEGETVKDVFFQVGPIDDSPAGG